MNPLLLLHGAIGAADQFEPLIKALPASFQIHRLNFSGHGGQPMGEDFSIAAFADEVLSYLDSNQIRSVDIFGYSMGGYVALCLARQHPERVGRIFTLATKFEWTPDIAQREAKMLNPDIIVQKIPAFAATLQKRHAPNNWHLLLSKTAEMMADLGERNALGADDFANIGTSIRLALGDRDTMVTLEETAKVYKSLPHASLCVLPDTAHPIEKVNVARLAYELQAFFN